MDIASLAEDALRLALKKGCDGAEVFIKASKSISAEAKDGGVEALETAREFGMAVKVIKGQRLGFSFISGPVDSQQSAVGSRSNKNVPPIDKCVEKALEGACWTGADGYNDIADFRSPSDVLIWDEDITLINEDDAIKNAVLLENGALSFDRKVKKVRKATSTFVSNDVAIFNSKGVNISYKGTSVSAHVMAIAQDGGDSQMGWDYGFSRQLKDIDFASIGAGAAKKAVMLLGAKKINAVKAPVILDPMVASEFLGILSLSFSAESVQKGKSLLADRVDKIITSPILNIIDDGTMPWCPGTSPVDDEGIPARRKVLIENGRLTGFLHNTYTARKAGIVSTGNAVRGSFKSYPGVGITNLYITPQDEAKGLRLKAEEILSAEGQKCKSAEEKTSKLQSFVSSVGKGLFVIEAMGVHTANPISGDFSVGISGLWIENGRPLFPVKEAVISGNIFEMFKRVGGVGKDLRFFGRLGSPSLLIGEMDISA
ncbi:MAG: TldD/PmbA family protein [Nitrospirae bacterium]|nr:TldD/PmbA family protein [Nitrospirota bacterium]